MNLREKKKAMRKRISITIKTSLLDRIDRLVDGLNVRNRSHAIETVIERALEVRSPEVFVLAGDEGCVKDINGRPVLEHLLRLMKKQGLERITISTVSSLVRSLREKFGDGGRLGLKIKYAEQKEKGGTAAALRGSVFNDTFLLVYGDNLFNFDLGELISFHRASNSVATIALTTVRSPEEYGVVELSGTRVVGFNEKPPRAESYIVSAGIFVLEPKTLGYLSQGASLEEVLSGMVRREKVSGYVLHGFWSSLGSREEERRAAGEFGGQ